MIEFLSGRLIEKTPTYLVIECQGVGYFVNISLHTYSKIEDVESCKVFTHLSIKEDAHTLYGFFENEERKLFRDLISVSGIGPNTARMMLSSLSPSEIQQAIIQSNHVLLQSIKGIGNKTAQRVVIDLKDKLNKKEIPGQLNLPSGNKMKEEALSALLTLGFPRNAVEKTLDMVFKQSAEVRSIEELIKLALKNM
jgi:Holliday junction DNA helicase RuvA